ncbi:type ISP restriction/modification enzyme [Kaistella jeonii]|uniref:type ISP restriction/modification enzyme n=1 Tax=Kaistella jeonii TaxID=266749 RepID=UPI0008E504CD|nr:type ISP restriction/modification enzyme [Kaistella jeonii]SFC35387.1 N-6 DNA Methylase [Kaistella jeonii]VEI95363.1 Predicted helicase [Kaistella jeonii]
MTLEKYITNINQRYLLGNATEHTFRGDLQQLIESLVPEIRATNEPKRQSCGAPDYILTKKDIPVGFIEAKDIGDKDLEGKKKSINKEQFDRYKASLDNLIFTDYLDFHLYHDGQFVTKIAIAALRQAQGDNKFEIVPLPENFATFENLIKDFCVHIGQNIKSPKKLAEMMAGKARLLSDVIEKALTSDETHNEDSTLKEQMEAFKSILIHDITPKGFADVYAQTIAYGMFAARLHDASLGTFSRQEAAELIPKSNPFLRKLFGYIAGPDIDDRIKWIVDNLAEIFLACNVEEILKNYGKTTKMEDPIIHFYETFLAEYDPSLRKARGVWYTPAPVVNFIVRAVDDILKTEFDLPQGLADTSKTKIKVDFQGKMVEKEVHKVQILDPATGTGTFLAEVIKHVHQKFKGQEGIWSSYVENNLLPRLNGFELLMASYAMAHLQLDLLLKETGFKATKEQRTRVYLTNSLEEHHPDTGTLFANWLSTEANEANHIKRDTPVMCVIGNPPYSGESANKGDWIMKLMEDYKKEPGGKEKLKERNPKWINDDYVKFLRYGQHFIEKNRSGVLAFINPHGFLDNPTFRGMRWNLLKTYDKIYTIDLHGNSKKKEVSPDGSVDQNVFDIMQGVSINIFIKTGKKKTNELGKVFHYDLYGKRDIKYDFLFANSLKTIQYKEIPNKAPDYFMVKKDFKVEDSYNIGISIKELFLINGVGMTTSHDNFVIKDSKEELLKFYKEFQNAPRDTEYLHKKFNVKKKIGWNILDGYDNIKNENDLTKYIYPITYRPFENKHIFYEDKLVWRTVRKIMRHLLNGENLGLVIGRQGQVVGDMPWNLAFLTNSITDFNLYYRGGGNLFPLYLYPETSGQLSLEETSERTPNLNPEIVKEIADKLGLQFVNEKSTSTSSVTSISTSSVTSISTSSVTSAVSEPVELAPIDLLDYIYAVLHSPTYREKYKEFLKIDFPRVPYPKDKDTFWQLVQLGGEIRTLHLLENPVIENYITQYPINGDNGVNKLKFELTNPDLPVLQSDIPVLQSDIPFLQPDIPFLNLDIPFLQPDIPFLQPDIPILSPDIPILSPDIPILNTDETLSKPNFAASTPKNGKVYINETQYFDNVPEIAWNFYIGGYQPARKWLKDRQGRTLEFEDILHYQKIIVALSETDRLMKQIDEIEIE